MDSLIGSRRRNAYALCAMACAALALPATGVARQSQSPGGGGVAPPTGTGTSTPPGSGTSTTPTTGSTQQGNVPVSTSGAGITLQTTASAMLRRGLSFSGTAPSGLSGDTLEIQRSGRQTHWRWASTVSATIQPDGSFTTVWHTNHIGQFAIRAVIASSSVAQGATATPSLTITVYRPSRATLYGPGFYGKRTACGDKLTRTTIGLANRTLKCGTKVALYYRGRTMTVPVIDRGPYTNGADWDLTMATGKALGLTGTAQIGAVSLPAR